MEILEVIFWGFIYILLFLIFFIILKLRRNEKQYNQNGIPYVGGALFRFFKIVFSGSLNDAFMDVYKRCKDTGSPVAVFTDFTCSSSVCVTNLDMIKNVCIKDFDYFVNRRPLTIEHSNRYFRKTLFILEDEQWKGVRGKVSPAFTTRKIRRMFAIFKASSERMTNYMKNQLGGSTGSDLDFLKLFPKYSMDVIASCAFGIDGKCFDVPPEQKSKFEKMGEGLQFSASLSFVFKLILMSTLPKLATYLRLELLDPEPQQFFAGVIKNEIKRRTQTGQRYEDILQLIMDAKSGMLKSDEEGVNEVMYGTSDDVGLREKIQLADKASKINFDDDHIAANAMAFMQGGFDPTQTILIFAVYELALEQEVQEKLYREIRDKIQEHGELTYEGINDMKYLDMFLNETLRVYPPPMTERICSKNYNVPGTSMFIKKGTLVSIPIHAIHHDPEFFESPEKFRPERFTSPKKEFMPFGMGPRNCIGMRFALIKVKAAIAQLVHTFHFEPCSRTMIPMKFDRNASPKPKGSMWIRVTIRK